MLAHPLDVVHFEAVAFEIGRGQTNIIELAAGKDEARDHFLITRRFSKLREIRGRPSGDRVVRNLGRSGRSSKASPLSAVFCPFYGVTP